MLLVAISSFATDLNERGYIRAMYLGAKDTAASAIGGSIGIAPSLGNFKSEIDFFTVAPFGAKEDAVSKLFSYDKSGYSILGVAALGYQKDGLSISIGRQKVTTPLIDMDDGRIVPNLYEGVSLKYAIAEKTRVEAYYLTRMSGF